MCTIREFVSEEDIIKSQAICHKYEHIGDIVSAEVKNLAKNLTNYFRKQSCNHGRSIEKKF